VVAEAIAQIIAGILTVLVPIIAYYLKKYGRKLFRIAECVVRVLDAVSELEDLQRHMLEELTGLLRKMSEGEAISPDEVEHVLEHCREKYETAQRLMRALRELREAIFG